MLAIKFKTSETFTLYLQLIPASPLGALLKDDELLSRTDQGESYTPPAPRTLPPEQLAKIPNRPELFSTVEHYRGLWEKARIQNAENLRRLRLEQSLRTEESSVDGKISSLQEQLRQSVQEPDWNHYGALLQTHFYSKPVVKNGAYELLDYETDETVRLPADPKLGLKEQLERYFHLAKRNKKRKEETAIRIQGLTEKKNKLEVLRTQSTNASTIEDFVAIEQRLGIQPAGRERLANKDQKKVAEFSGKQYRSKEGLTILVGRNRIENIELTFKIARGNDLWLHVRGRPGSHTVILLPPKKTASLDTLLDAATLCILHSGGKEWGKTDVDYTYRKFVKKIKNQTEVSYTHNKTLSVTIEESRLKRLYHDGEI